MRNFLKTTYLHKIRSCLLILLSWPLYLLSYFIPRNKNVWVFGAWFGRRYADNSRHVYEYVCENRKYVRAIWLSRNRDVVDFLRKNGSEAYMVSSFYGFWFSCRASVVISSNGKMDVNRPAISKAIKIQLWHGIPLKKIGIEDDMMPYYHNGWRGRVSLFFHHVIIGIEKAMFPFLLENWDFIASTSPVISERMASAFDVSESRVVITGYPRNDILLDGRRRISSAFTDIFESRKFKKFILYAPTFRNRYEDNVSLFKGFDLKAIDACLKNHDALFMIKMHPIFDAAALMIKDITTPNIYWIKENDISELNELLPNVDLLITDYSGAYFDYLLLDRPIIFTPFDIEQYVKMDRDFYEDYDEATPGVKCNNWTEVLDKLDMILSGEDRYKTERLRALNKYHSYCDVESSKRVYELAKSLVAQQMV